MEHTGESYEHAASGRDVRRARRRRFLWAATAVLVLAAVVIALWPTQNRYRATATVEVVEPGGEGGSIATLEYDADDVTEPASLSRLIQSLEDADTVKVQLHSTASTRETATRQLTDATEVVRSTAGAVAENTASPRERADAELEQAREDLNEAQATRDKRGQEFADASSDLEGQDPDEVIENAQVELEEAQEAGDEAAIEQAEVYLTAVRKLVQSYNTAQANADAAEAEVGRKATRVDALQTKANSISEDAATEITVSPVREDVLEGTRPTGRLSLAAILLVLAIASADALFLTRTKMKLPEPERRRRGQKSEPAPLPPLVPGPTGPLPPVAPAGAAATRVPAPAPAARPEPPVAPRTPTRRAAPQPAAASVPPAAPPQPARRPVPPASTPPAPPTAPVVPAAARTTPVGEPKPARPAPAPAPAVAAAASALAPSPPVAQPAPPPARPAPAEPAAAPPVATPPAEPAAAPPVATPPVAAPPPAPAPPPAQAPAPAPAPTAPTPVPVAEPARGVSARPVPSSLRRRHPRRRQRIAASPLDLPNIEVHLLDREGGLRAVQLRDATPSNGAPQSNGADDAE